MKKTKNIILNEGIGIDHFSARVEVVSYSNFLLQWFMLLNVIHIYIYIYVYVDVYKSHSINKVSKDKHKMMVFIFL